MTKINVAILLSCIIMFFSCETDITVDLPVPPEKLVVEGYIYTGEAPVIFLTRNAGYFAPIDSTSLYKTLVIDSTAFSILSAIGLTQAEIDILIVSPDLQITIRDESTLEIDTMSVSFFPQFPFVGYTCSNIIGEAGKQYRLNIHYNNQDFWGYTSIPQSIPIDSVWFSHMRPEEDSLGYLGFQFIDPPEAGNYYAVHSRVETEQISFLKPYFGGNIGDDTFGNGDTLKWEGMSKGYDSNAFLGSEIEDHDEFKETAFFGCGTTVQIRLSTIDAESFMFWNSLDRHLATSGNPFTNPGSIKSNMQGGNVLGFWAGYGTSFKRFKINDDATIEYLP